MTVGPGGTETSVNNFTYHFPRVERSQILFPAPTPWLIIICNSRYRNQKEESLKAKVTSGKKDFPAQ